MDEIQFKPWPKIPRLYREIVISEKIDGTNAAVIITDDGAVGAQSRNRLITPENDNHGFAAWAQKHADILASTLGPGTHYGEWWGHGIQRGYNLARGDRRFSLFNTIRYNDLSVDATMALSTIGCSPVPQMYVGVADWGAVDAALNDLRKYGSFATPYPNPEGIVLYHTASRQMYKVTLEDDAAPKTLVVQAQRVPKLPLAA